MSFDLGNKVLKCLKTRADERFTAKQIAQWIFEQYPEECENKRRRSQAIVAPLVSDAALIQQIASEIRARELRGLASRGIKTTQDKPRRFYYTVKTDLAEIEEAESDSFATGYSLREVDLYPILSSFLWSEFGLYSKRIDEKRSHNKNGSGGNKWLYPDMVAMEDLTAEWHGEIKQCVKNYAAKKTRLWSFEVKCLVNRSNIREVFFQTVSNSSWANFSYLVASEIAGNETIKELRLLSSLHGVGVIRLNKENPAEGDILIPAQERAEIDWNNANRLAQENADFLGYIQLIRHFYQTGDVRTIDWHLFHKS